MSHQLINPASLHPAPGFSHISVASGSRTVHFAGQVALDKNFNVIGAGDLYAQARAAMDNLAIAIGAAGVTWDQIVRRTIYTTQPTQYETITRAIHAVTSDAADPPQTIVGVTGLAVDGLLIEIECTAITS